MLCRNPLFINGVAAGCGQCGPCRLNKRREWTHRIMLEAQCHAKNAFVTLTYDQNEVPGDGSLVPEDLTKFLKRLRDRLQPERIRYYAVGEYGDKSQRPHYHLAVFNLASCAKGRTPWTRHGFRPCGDGCSCLLVHEEWGKGRIEVAQLEAHSAQYIAGYVVKKMTKKDDPRLNGRYPEFARMSRRPGIGANFIPNIVGTLNKLGLDATNVDVRELRHGKKKWPLGRYLGGKLLEEITPDLQVSKALRRRAARNKLRELQTEAKAAYEAGLALNLKDYVLSKGEGKAINIEAAHKRKRNKSL